MASEKSGFVSTRRGTPSSASGFVSRRDSNDWPVSEDGDAASDISGFVGTRRETRSSASRSVSRRDTNGDWSDGGGGDAASDISGFLSTRRGSPGAASGFVSRRASKGRPVNEDEASGISGFVSTRRGPPSSASGFVSRRDPNDGPMNGGGDAASDISGFLSTRRGSPGAASGFVSRVAVEDLNERPVIEDDVFDDSSSEHSGFVDVPTGRTQSQEVPRVSQTQTSISEEDDAASDKSGFVSTRGGRQSEASPPRRDSNNGPVGGVQVPAMDLGNVTSEMSGFVPVRRGAPIVASRKGSKADPKKRVLHRVAKGRVAKKQGTNRRPPGAKAAQEIQIYQRHGRQLIPKAPFARVVREICQFLRAEEFRFTKEALVALQEAAEAVIVNLFEHAQICARHGKRVTVMPRDIQLVRLIRDDV